MRLCMYHGLGNELSQAVVISWVNTRFFLWVRRWLGQSVPGMSCPLLSQCGLGILAAEGLLALCFCFCPLCVI